MRLRRVKSCKVCQESRALPSPAPLHPRQWPKEPWSQLHFNFAGPHMGHMLLVIQDAHAKWLDAHVMSTITASKTTDMLWVVFATHGLPHRQWPIIYKLRIREFRARGWHTSHYIRPLPPFQKRFGGGRCSNLKMGPQMHSRIDCPRETVKIFVQLPNYPSFDDGYSTKWTFDVLYYMSLIHLTQYS